MHSDLSKISKYAAIVEHKKSVLKKLIKTNKALKKENKKLVSERRYHKDGIIVLEYLININYDNVVKMFENTITAALKTFWNDQYDFQLDIGRRGDSVSVEFQLLTDKYDVHKVIQMTQGASVQQIVGTIIRIVLVKLDKSLPDFIILDEPLQGLNKNMQYKAGEFFTQLAKDFNLQMIIITQSEQFAKNTDEIITITS